MLAACGDDVTISAPAPWTLTDEAPGLQMEPGRFFVRATRSTSTGFWTLAPSSSRAARGVSGLGELWHVAILFDDGALDCLAPMRFDGAKLEAREYTCESSHIHINVRGKLQHDTFTFEGTP